MRIFKRLKFSTYTKLKFSLYVLFSIFFLILLFDFFPKWKKVVFIPSNVSSEKIAMLLYQQNLIFSTDIFLIFSYLTNSDERLKSGMYELSYSLTGLPAILKLRKGPMFIKVTIPEGFRTEQIAERLLSRGVIVDIVEFLTYIKSKNLDGFLFPDTYFFSFNEPVEKVASVMEKNFYTKYRSVMDNENYTVKLTTRQVVILASIVEKEAKSFEEKRLVAGVFHNRLKKGLPLESCATVRFALKKFKEPLTYKDLQVRSPYNTYLHKGLPPGPICNPGLDSIKAVLDPEKTDAMFFFTKDNQTHKFSKHYNVHIEEQKKWRKTKK